MRETTAILVTLVAYNVVLLAIGVAAQRRATNVAEFFLGGRKLGPWVAALSASASSSSAWTLLGVSGYAYVKGLSAIWIFPACVGGFALNWFVLAPRLRRRSAETGALTVIELLAGPASARGSKAIRWLATAILLVSLMTYVASQFQGAGKTFQETFALDLPSSILLGSGIVIAYTMMGGFWAVSLTDTFQGMLMVIAAVLLPVGALAGVGGIAGLVEGVTAVGDPYTSLVQGLPMAAAIGMVLGLLGIGLGYPGQPHVVNFFMAMKDESAVSRARAIAMVWATVMYAGMITLGLCARVLFPGLPDGEVAFVVVAKNMFGPVVAGVLLAAVLAAIMSTVDSQLLVAASSVAHDVRTIETNTQTTVRTSRLTVLGVSVAAVVAALVGDPTIFSKVLFAWTAMGAAFGPLLLVELWAGPVPWRGRLAAIGVGFSSAIAGYVLAPGTAWERVAPFALALVVALAARRTVVGRD